MNAHVPLPDFTIRDGTPVALGFDDVYFSRAGGVAETEHVFLKSNGLPDRFAAQGHFTIAELGFGTGLNFLVTYANFLKHAPEAHHLHYTSVEKFPLTPDMLKEALLAYPELRTLAAKLIAAYPLRLPGFHRIHLPRVTLTLSFGDAAVLLPQLDAKVDAWFLDGFAPAKNPDMWSDALFAEIARLSAPGATFATFTSAGAVRRGLEAVGFTVEKIAGFGQKREMSRGALSGSGSTSPAAQKSVIVVGGGIAGCTLARALAERGCAVTLFERGEIAGGASGNPAGVLFPQLTKRWTSSAAWYFAAYSFALHQLARWKAAGLSFSMGEIGMLRLPRHAEEEAQLRALNEALGLDPEIVHWLETKAASGLAGVSLATGAAFFPRGTWTNPGELCRALVTHPNVTIHTQCDVISATRQATGWVLETADKRRFESNLCCISAAAQTAAFLQHKNLQISQVSGQVSVLSAAQTAAKISAILCHKGYVIPQGDSYLIGATYNHGDDSFAVTAENHAKNLAEVETFLPGWAQGQPGGGRTAMRATTPDRMPYIGQLEDGLWVSAGFGSRGLLSAPLAAEAIASEICGEASPLTVELRKAVNPLRFKS